MSGDAEYWAQRALEREMEAALEGAELTHEMFRKYQQAARRIRQHVRDFYSRYAGEYGLTYEEAVRTLNLPEMQEWKKTLGEYVDAIKAAEDDVLRARLQAELDALAYNSRITRLQALEGQINLELNDLFDQGVAQMKERFGDLFEEGYYKKVFDIQQRAGSLFEFAHVTTSMVGDIVSYPWSGAHFSDRLWRHKDALVFSTRELLTRGAIEGTGIGPMSKALADLMGQSYKNAERLITTEAAHFHEEADFRAYDAAGVREYEFRARLNERTCPTCGALDGKKFKVSERQEGSNAPPMHPRCHCTTVEHDPNEALDWVNSGKEMPHRMTYEEWKREQGVKTPAEEQKAADRKLLKERKADDTIKPDEEKLRQALREVEEESRGLDYEVGTILDRQGNILNVTRGGESIVEPPEELLAGNVFTHNHPSGGMFSVDDIQSFEATGLYEVRASTPQGIVYSLKMGAAVPEPGIGEAYKKIEALQKALAQVREELKKAKLDRDEVKRGGWPMIYERMGRINRQWLEENAEKYGYIFTVEEPDHE